MKILAAIFYSILMLSVQSAFCKTKDTKKLGSNLQPLSFGDDQTIIDLNKLVWEPLRVKGMPAGAEIAILRGNLESGSSGPY